jgi:aryl-phospho-beta-D-glucosidase BglC (GH1 family)
MNAKVVLLLGVASLLPGFARAQTLMPWVEVAKDKSGFVLRPSDKPFVPWGFNYDHDEKGRLLEDYWETEWPKIEADFAQMKTLGANVVRVHLQLGKFMDGPDKPNAKALDRLAKLVRLAETTGLYLNLTGLGCYHKADVPAWYDKLAEKDRWDVQARFWAAVAGRCADSPAIFCYDLMNEPVVPGGRRKNDDRPARRSAGSTSSSSSRSTSKTGHAPTSPGSGSSTSSPPSARMISGTSSPWGSWTGVWTARG